MISYASNQDLTCASSLAAGAAGAGTAGSAGAATEEPGGEAGTAAEAPDGTALINAPSFDIRCVITAEGRGGTQRVEDRFTTTLFCRGVPKIFQTGPTG